VNWTVETPWQLYQKPERVARDRIRERPWVPPVEWFADFYKHCKEVFFQVGNLWSKDKSGLLVPNPKTKHWRIWKELPCIMENYSNEYQPIMSSKDFDFTYKSSEFAYFSGLFRRHYGEIVRAIGFWQEVEGKPNNDRNVWHCQYATNSQQRGLMQRLGCRGAGRHTRSDQEELTDRQMKLVGSTTITLLQEGTWGPDPSYHGLEATVLVLPQMFLLNPETVTARTAYLFYKRQPKVAHGKAHAGYWAPTPRERPPNFRGQLQ